MNLDKQVHAAIDSLAAQESAEKDSFPELLQQSLNGQAADGLEKSFFSARNRLLRIAQKVGGEHESDDEVPMEGLCSSEGELGASACLMLLRGYQEQSCLALGPTGLKREEARLELLVERVRELCNQDLEQQMKFQLRFELALLGLRSVDEADLRDYRSELIELSTEWNEFDQVFDSRRRSLIDLTLRLHAQDEQMQSLIIELVAWRSLEGALGETQLSAEVENLYPDVFRTCVETGVSLGRDSA